MGAVALADGPEPGPADAAALVLLGALAVDAISELIVDSITQNVDQSIKTNQEVMANDVETDKQEIRRPTTAQMEQTLAEAGRARPGPGYSPHHIVPIFGFKKLQDGLITEGMRSLLDANGIGINSAENLIWLPNHDAARIPGDMSILHGVGHRFDTILAVNQRIQIGAAAGGTAGVSAALASIRADFNAGVVY